MEAQRFQMTEPRQKLRFENAETVIESQCPSNRLQLLPEWQRIKDFKIDPYQAERIQRQCPIKQQLILEEVWDNELKETKEKDLGTVLEPQQKFRMHLFGS